MSRSAIPSCALLAATLALTPLLAGCAGDSAAEPLHTSREALGTVVAITAYAESDSRAAEALDAAYDAMAAVEAELDAHDPDSAVARVNSAPEPAFEPLPPYAEAVLDAICVLEVREWFSPQLWALSELWAFEEGGHVPSAAELDVALADPRYDFGGAAKGLALDEAAETLRSSSAVDAALIASGSTTLAYGAKPDGEPWRIGVEDPRDPAALVATIEAAGDITVSTSGDYQRAFDRNGVRYHHILDPATGRPALGFRSLSVVGDISGLDSDILSTALFVAGPARAMSYAEEHGLGLVIVDAGGRTHIVPGPADRTWEIVTE